MYPVLPKLSHPNYSYSCFAALKIHQCDQTKESSWQEHNILVQQESYTCFDLFQNLTYITSMFFDRHSAGISLAQKLKEYKNRNVVVYALTKGGVPVGYEVARFLGVPLDMVIVQKIGHPVSPEYGICAVAEGGELVKDDCGLCGLDESWVNYEIALKKEEIKRQRYMYKRNVPSISAEEKIAILVDDGLSTGITMKAAVHAISSDWPAEIVVAVPVGPHDVIEDLRSMVDRVVVENEDRTFQGALRGYYFDYTSVTDQDVVALLKQAEQRQTISAFSGSIAV